MTLGPYFDLFSEQVRMRYVPFAGITPEAFAEKCRIIGEQYYANPTAFPDAPTGWDRFVVSRSEPQQQSLL